MAETPPVKKPEWLNMKPYTQGYCSYMYSSWPGSDIPAVNPYPKDTPEHEAFCKGELAGVLEAQDQED